MNAWITEAEVRRRVKEMVKEFGGVRATAKVLSVTPSYVSDVCNGRRAPGPPFLEALCLKKVIGYLPAKISVDVPEEAG